MRALRQHLTYANVVSSLCLFVLLGGSAYAATRIDGSTIKNRSIPGTKIQKNKIGGDAVKESALGTIPNAVNARTLDGMDSAGFVKGRAGVEYGVVRAAAAAADAPAARSLATPIGTFELRCQPGAASANVRYANNTATVTEVWRTRVGPAANESNTAFGVVETDATAGVAYEDPYYAVIKASQGSQLVEIRVHARAEGENCTFNYELVKPTP